MMWKKLAIFATVFCVSLSGIFGNTLNVFAQEVEESDLLTDDAIVGYMDAQTKGVYLASGYSVIKDGGSGKIIAGGGTDATMPCSVRINVIIERLDDGWRRVTSWTGSRENALSVVSSKTLSVGKGYYYRVRCVHYAESDVSDSCTSAFLVN